MLIFVCTKTIEYKAVKQETDQPYSDILAPTLSDLLLKLFLDFQVWSKAKITQKYKCKQRTLIYI